MCNSAPVHCAIIECCQRRSDGAAARATPVQPMDINECWLLDGGSRRRAYPRQGRSHTGPGGNVSRQYNRQKDRSHRRPTGYGEDCRLQRPPRPRHVPVPVPDAQQSPTLSGTAGNARGYEIGMGPTVRSDGTGAVIRRVPDPQGQHSQEHRGEYDRRCTRPTSDRDHVRLRPRARPCRLLDRRGILSAFPRAQIVGAHCVGHHGDGRRRRVNGLASSKAVGRSGRCGPRHRCTHRDRRGVRAVLDRGGQPARPGARVTVPQEQRRKTHAVLDDPSL